jgi:hypothetical protein
LGDLRTTFYIIYTSYGFVKRPIIRKEIECSTDIEQAALIRNSVEAEELAREAIKEYGTTVIFELPGGTAYEAE